MAWNEPGGNKKDPWSGSGGNGSGGGGNQPPDLDEVFRNLNRKLGGLLGKKKRGGNGGEPTPIGSSSGSGGSKGIWLIVVLALVGYVLYNSVHIIQASERGVVLRLGEYNREFAAGLNFAMPYPIEQVQVVDVEQVRQITDRGTMLTRDENIVNIDFAVQYRVNDAMFFLFKVQDPEMTLEQAAESAVREIIGNNVMDDIITGETRAALSEDVRQLIEDILTRYETGLEVTAFALQDVQPPQAVKAAFDDAVKAREDRTRFENEAEAYRNSVIPEARGRAARIVQDAEAYKAAVIARAEGEADRFNLLLAEYLKAPEVTRQRLYLQAMESVLGNASKVMIDVEGGNNLMYLPLDQMMRAGAAIPRSNDRGGLDSSTTTVVPSEDIRARDAARRGREGR